MVSFFGFAARSQKVRIKKGKDQLVFKGLDLTAFKYLTLILVFRDCTFFPDIGSALMTIQRCNFLEGLKIEDRISGYLRAEKKASQLFEMTS
jgi:hypothetical protein